MNNMVAYVWCMYLDVIQTGGFVMWPICIVSIVIWGIGLERFFYTLRMKWLCDRCLVEKSRISLFEKCNVGTFDLSNKTEADCLLIFKELLIEIVPKLNKKYSYMSSLIMIAPLLGLLGTVIGMIETFAIIMKYGIGNPQMMAEGISVALLTTQAGLIAAFPGMIIHNRLLEMKDVLIKRVEKYGERTINEVRTKEREKRCLAIV